MEYCAALLSDVPGGMKKANFAIIGRQGPKSWWGVSFSSRGGIKLLSWGGDGTPSLRGGEGG